MLLRTVFGPWGPVCRVVRQLRFYDVRILASNPQTWMAELSITACYLERLQLLFCVSCYEVTAFRNHTTLGCLFKIDK